MTWHSSFIAKNIVTEQIGAYSMYAEDRSVEYPFFLSFLLSAAVD